MNWLLFFLTLLGSFFFVGLIHNQEKTLWDIPKLYSILWGTGLLANFLLLNGLLQVSTRTQIIIGITWWLFLFGYFVAIKKVNISHKFELNIRPAIIIFYGIYFIYLYIFVIQIKDLNVFNSLNPNNIKDSLINLRVTQAFWQDSIPFFLEPFKGGGTFFIPLGLMLYREKVVSKRIITSVILSTLLISALHFTRAPILSVFIITLTSIYYLFPGKRRIVVLFGSISGLLIILTFVSMQLQLIGKGIQVSFEQMIAPYIGSSFKAYEIIVNGEYIKNSRGFYSFDSLNFILERIGSIESYPSLIRNYIDFPIVTNIYTYLDVFTLDFGIMGAFLGSFFYGCFCGYLSNVMKQGSYLGFALYSTSMYHISMSTLNNEFIRFGFLMFFLVAFSVSFFVNRNIITKEKRMGQ